MTNLLGVSGAGGLPGHKVFSAEAGKVPANQDKWVTLVVELRLH